MKKYIQIFSVFILSILLLTISLMIQDKGCLRGYACNIVGWFGYNLVLIIGILLILQSKRVVLYASLYTIIITLLANGFKPISEIFEAFVANAFIVVGLLLLKKVISNVKTTIQS